MAITTVSGTISRTAISASGGTSSSGTRKLGEARIAVPVDGDVR